MPDPIILGLTFKIMKPKYLRVFIPCRIALGNTSNYAALDQMDDLQIYLHEPDNFLFFAYRDTMPNNLKIKKSMLQLSLD